MKRRSPQGYWTSVFEQAKVMLNNHWAVTPEDAFWMARRKVDQNLGEGLFPADHGRAERDQPVLMLS